MEFPAGGTQQLQLAIKLVSLGQADLRRLLSEVASDTGAFTVLPATQDELHDVSIGPRLRVTLLPLPAVEWTGEGDDALARWVISSAQKRQSVLQRVCEGLAQHQARWLEGELDAPLSVDVAVFARSLELHEPTVRRLVQGKRVAHPRGEGPLDTLLGLKN